MNKNSQSPNFLLLINITDIDWKKNVSCYFERYWNKKPEIKK